MAKSHVYSEGSNIFSSKASPFFHFARIMSLDGLDIDELYEYTKDEGLLRKYF
ncbi:MAG: hypothetical protein IE909_08060 [Campylobacterales bacterium]|nr:hypothetical protein [Campylobacterales bacterium]